MAPIGSEQPGANLPAPYRSPWLVLAGDLVAVGADLALRCRELWRRNRQGELSCPRFWPGSIAAVFWPLVVVLAVGLLGAGLWGLARPGALPASAPPGLISRGVSNDPSPALALPGLASTALASTALASPGADAMAQNQPPPIPLLQREVLPQTPASEAPGAQGPAPGATQGQGASPGSGSPGSPPASAAQDRQLPLGDGALALEPPPIAANPLESWRQRPEAAGLLLQVGGDPASSRIQLVLSDAFGQLPGSEQQQRADLWLGWAHDWGYDQLELRGLRGTLLGREARVGGGMILGFSP